MTYIILDLEATCCDKNTLPRSEMEIIEIGAVALDGNGPQIVDEFQAFVRPVQHPQLTEFCTTLTSITQENVDSAETFPTVISQLSTWVRSFSDPVFCSWGNYDKKQLLQDCAFHKVDFPFSDLHINIKQRFADNLGLKRGTGLGKALARANLNFEGTAHRGIDDARNMARLSSYIFKQQ